MQFLKLVEEKIVEKAPEDCDGCTDIIAYVFKGVKPGQDTIKHFETSPHDTCSTSLLNSMKDTPNFSIVTVTN